VANAQQQLTNAQRDTELSLVQLKTLMGVHPDSKIDTVGSLGFEPAAAFIERLVGQPAPEAQPDSPPASKPDLVDRYRSRLLPLAERQRPELQSARLRVEQAQEGIGVARSAYRPQVAVGAMADWMTGSHTSTLGAASF